MSLASALSSRSLLENRKDICTEGGRRDDKGRADAGLDPSSRSDLCDDCLKFDFHIALGLDLIVLKEKYTAGFVVANVVARFRQSLETKCPSCLILSRSRITYTDDSKEETYDELRAFFFWRNFHQIEMRLNIARRPVGKDFLIPAIVPPTHKGFGLSISIMQNGMAMHFSRAQRNHCQICSLLKLSHDILTQRESPGGSNIVKGITLGFVPSLGVKLKVSSSKSQAYRLRLTNCQNDSRGSYLYSFELRLGPSVKIVDLQDDPQCCDEPRLPSFNLANRYH